MSILDATGLSKRYAGRVVLSDVSLVISEGERVGLVGNNGSGKSTLGRLLAALERPDAGEIARRRGVRVDYLAQEPEMPAGSTVRDYVSESLADWKDARRRHDAATAALATAPDDGDSLVADRWIAEQAAAADEIERRGGWERLFEVDAVIDHLGIARPERLVETLSGGERRRAALARVLVGSPDLAILDEPTNHLDIATIEWLEEYLESRFRGALLLITHDRWVLDRVTERTLELDRGRLESYAGGYEAYLEGKAERQAHVERTESNRQNFLRRELEWMRRGPKARGTKQKARLGRAQEAASQRKPERERTAELTVTAERQGRTILALEGLSLERDGVRLVERLDLALSAGQRVGVLGPNGSGKTSLLLTVQGQLEPVRGAVTLGARTRVGYLDQGRGDLADDDTVFDAVAEGGSTVEVAGEQMTVASYLERFLFDRAAQRVKVGELSGGERARVCLARLLSRKTNLLLLDEPTNDLDVDTLSALEAMLCDFTGSALIVSHDRWFLDRVATSILSFEGDGVLEVHAGGYSAYRERKHDALAGERIARALVVQTTETTVPARRPRAPGKLSFNEERELAGLVDRIDAAEREVDALSQRLADPKTYRLGGEEIGALRRALDEARALAGDLTVRWESLEERKAGTAGA